MAGNILGRFFLRAGNFLVRRTVVLSDVQQQQAKWFADKGDVTHRVRYDLNADSIVFDLGGYKGDWTSDIAAMYVCTVHVFEGIDTYAENIVRRFARNPKIHIHAFGLSNADSSQTIRIAEERSSQFGSEGEVKQLKLVKASDFLAAEKIEKVDLIKINIEGGEYDLLEHLLDSGNINRFVNIQVQFHNFVPDAESRMTAIQNRLHKTHERTYHYPFVWENWRLKA